MTAHGFRESLRIGVRSILANRLRSLLTMLGMIFGVAAVVSMVSIAEGARHEAAEQLRLLGTNNIRVHRRELGPEARAQAEQRGVEGLVTEDAERLADTFSNLRGVAPVRFVDTPVLRGSREAGARVVATNDAYASITDFRAVDGRFLAPLDLSAGKRVAVLGATIRHELFGSGNPVGHRIRVGGQWFTVVGVMEAKEVREGRTSVIKVRDVNRDVYVPITTANARLPDDTGLDGIHEIALQVETAAQVEPTARAVAHVLDRYHQGIEDFELVVPAELLAQAQRTQRVFNIVMGSIAAISLLVGGIGIMNVMLTTVTERTREIGIRRAIGATRRTILAQFLIETVLVSTAGGCLGIVAGAVMAQGIHRFAGWKTVVSPEGMILAFGISAAVGVIFGLVPARRAARMEPVQALRFE